MELEFGLMENHTEIEKVDTREKALRINLDPSKYGVFAEIGAGQEVARNFFRVGGAAGTVAKTMSAYDMTVSDSIYGPAKRYVSQERLENMIQHEYGLILERLRHSRGSDTQFFCFADTVKARSYMANDNSHGWMGIRFQSKPGNDPSTIIMHVKMWDNTNLQQQEALGVMGVNLIYGALYHYDRPNKIIQGLLDNLNTKRVEVDLIQFSGPDFPNIDNRLMALELVEKGLTNAATFDAQGQVIQPAELLYKKAILIERGSFRPMTRATMDMIRAAKSQFIQEPNVVDEPVEVLMEMTLNNLSDSGTIDHSDFLSRADMLNALGHNVMISNFGAYHRLAAYLFQHTKKMIGIVMGVPSLREIFEPKYYTDLDGGILESFGRLFKNDLKLYIYPQLGSISGSMITAGNLRVAPNLRHLYAYLLENQYIQGLRDIDESCLPHYSRDVLKKIADKDPAWEEMVPELVVKMIKERRTFGYTD